MICEKNAKKYCCEDISNIENYDKAIADLDNVWEIHHLAEILPCGRFTKQNLIEFNLYLNRPANELIFLRHDVHRSMHHSGNTYRIGQVASFETRQKMSNSLKGRTSPMKGRHHSEESKANMRGWHHTEDTKNRISIALKGRKKSDEERYKLSVSHKGKIMSEEARRKMSIAKKGKTPWNKGKKIK